MISDCFPISFGSFGMPVRVLPEIRSQLTMCDVTEVIPYNPIPTIGNEFDVENPIIKPKYTLIATKYDDKAVYDHTEDIKHRSTLLDPNGRIMSISPPHFLSKMEFDNRYQRLIQEKKILCSEWIEGSLINLFYNYEQNHWDIMTKQMIGGDKWFIRTEYKAFDGDEFVVEKQKTFREMFMEAFGGEDKYHEFVFHCDTECVYSFILQHPSNPLVTGPKLPKIFLASVQQLFYNYETATTHVRYIPSSEFEYWPYCRDNKKIYFPDRLDFDTITKKNTDQFEELGIYGYVMTDPESGNRTLIIDPLYEILKELRRNDPNILYTLLTQMKENRIADFNSRFPWFLNLYSWLCEKIKHLVQYLYQSYVALFIKKTPNLYFEKNIYVTLHEIHRIFYMNAHQKINLDVVMYYFIQQNVSTQLHLLTRKDNIDEIELK